jgi:hypothetical protein
MTPRPGTAESQRARMIGPKAAQPSACCCDGQEDRGRERGAGEDERRPLTATRIRYGIPQITHIDPKSAHDRRDIDALYQRAVRPPEGKFSLVARIALRPALPAAREHRTFPLAPSTERE